MDVVIVYVGMEHKGEDVGVSMYQCCDTMSRETKGCWK